LAGQRQGEPANLVDVADLSDLQRFSAVFERHFPEPRPVRTTMGAALLGGAEVKITAVARRDTGRAAAAKEWRGLTRRCSIQAGSDTTPPRSAACHRHRDLVAVR
jgi:hypothetical protein